VDGNALHVVASNLDLAGVQPATNVNVERLDGCGNRAGASHRAARAVERGQKSVS
jgi:hypothetical protein